MKKIYTCFPGGKHKVLTMSYDDGRKEDYRLVDIFNKNGIKATFNLNSGIRDDERRINFEEYSELYKGHEIACHTYNHPTIERCPMELIVREVLEDRKGLEEITGYPVKGMAYPNGSYNEKIKAILPSLGIKYSRIVGNTEDFAMPSDWLEWKATCHHNHRLLELLDEFLSLHKTQYLYMMYVWGHSFEFRTEEDWALIEEFSKRAGNKDDIWYATNIQIVDYMEAADRLEYSSDLSFVYNPSYMPVYIQVDDEIVVVNGGEQKNI